MKRQIGHRTNPARSLVPHGKQERTRKTSYGAPHAKEEDDRASERPCERSTKSNARVNPVPRWRYVRRTGVRLRSNSSSLSDENQASLRKVSHT